MSFQDNVTIYYSALTAIGIVAGLVGGLINNVFIISIGSMLFGVGITTLIYQFLDWGIAEDDCEQSQQDTQGFNDG